MAYLDGYLHDVFFSYARGPHGGSAYKTKPLQRWVLKFHDHLAHQVNFYLQQADPDAKAECWIDRLISRTTPVDQSLTQAVQGAALFVCVMSNYYLESEYCSREIASFKNDFADAGANQDRIFVVNIC